MKPVLFKSKLILLLIAFLTFAACSKDEDVPTTNIPTVNYSVSTFDATFFQAGTSSAPSIQWNGSQGSFALATPLTGSSINTVNGVMSWDKTLPIGTHDLQVIVTNSAGHTTANVSIKNPFQGVFTGTIEDGNTNYFEVEFFSDGTVIAKTEDSGSPPIANGTWTKNGTTVVVDLTNHENNIQVSLSGTLSIGTTVIYNGQWHNGHGANDPLGDFEVTLNN